VEEDGTRMLFVAVRRNLGRIAVDARLPGRLGALAREIEEQARILSRRS